MILIGHMIVYPMMPAISRQVRQYRRVHFFPNIVAVVCRFACLSALISGIAE